jgi:hypothetical protein
MPYCHTRVLPLLHQVGLVPLKVLLPDYPGVTEVYQRVVEMLEVSLRKRSLHSGGEEFAYPREHDRSCL